MNTPALDVLNNRKEASLRELGASGLDKLKSMGSTAGSALSTAAKATAKAVPPVAKAVAGAASSAAGKIKAWDQAPPTHAPLFKSGPQQ